MNRIIRLLSCAAISLPSFVGAAWADGESNPHATQANPALPAFEVCRAVVRVSGSARPGLAAGPLKANVYLSDVMPRGPVNDQDITWAFERFLAEKYGQPHAAEECRHAWTRQEAVQIRDVAFHEGPGELTFIDTGWQYQPAAKAAAAPAPSTAAPAGSTSPGSGPAVAAAGQYAVCWANMNPNVKYYSAVFDGSRDDAGKWWPAFQKFLQQKYSFNGPTQCIPARAQADAESYLKNLIDKDGTTRTMSGQPPQIVRTGWKY
jgi:hypothetical protein